MRQQQQQQQMIKLYKNLYKLHHSSKMQKGPKITLNQQQKKLFDCLKKSRTESGLKTVLRVAGGWVRDKVLHIYYGLQVLGKQSKDIDIALDDIKGEEFVSRIADSMKNHGEGISGFGVTKLNPDQSKHLETATAKINNQWIDFVNLRCQDYNQQSRIPTMKFGTPLQDAERRDFTVNSLFYNIQTQEVEDFTEKGLIDLENKVLRTPLQPIVTFKDDPLRILRCLRFKSRLNFKIDQKIYEAMKNHDIQQALAKKVSRERVGIELGGLLRAKYFIQGLRDIRDYNLWNIVFQIPKQSQLFLKKTIIEQIPNCSFQITDHFIRCLNQNKWLTEKQLIAGQTDKQHQQQQSKPDKMDKKAKLKKKQKIQYSASDLQFLMLISSLTYVYHEYETKVGKSKVNLVPFMIKDQLKYPGKYADFAYHFAQSVDKLTRIQSVNNIYAIIRWLRFAEQKWELAIHYLHAYCQVLKKQCRVDLLKLREQIINRNLVNCYLTQGPIDGSYLTKKGIKGPAIGKILQNAIIWRIINPNKPNEQFQKQFEENGQFFKSDNTYH